MATSEYRRRTPEDTLLYEVVREHLWEFFQRAEARLPDGEEWPGRSRIDWATLLRRSMDLDALKCPRCPGTMRVIASIEDEEVGAKILAAMGIPSDLRVTEPSRAPPAEDFEFAQ